MKLLQCKAILLLDIDAHDRFTLRISGQHVDPMRTAVESNKQRTGQAEKHAYCIRRILSERMIYARRCLDWGILQLACLSAGGLLVRVADNAALSLRAAFKLIPTAPDFFFLPLVPPRRAPSSIQSIIDGVAIGSKTMSEATEDEFPDWSGIDWWEVCGKTTRYTDVKIQDIEPSRVKAYSTDKLNIEAAPSQSEKNPEQIAKERGAISKLRLTDE